MGKIINTNLLYLFLFFVFIISCKSTQETKIQKDDPTKYVIDKNNIKKDELKEVMKALFELIEKNIADANFQGWYDFLSKDYKNFLNNKEELLRLSKISDYLKNREIILTGPRDYFKHVIIASREGKSLEFVNYDYINDKYVKVISLFDKKEKYVYKFKVEGDSWKLDY